MLEEDALKLIDPNKTGLARFLRECATFLRQHLTLNGENGKEFLSYNNAVLTSLLQMFPNSRLSSVEVHCRRFTEGKRREGLLRR